MTEPASASVTEHAGARAAGPTAGDASNPLFEFLCRMGDDRLILGQRLAQWCGHAPILEEDIALTNFSLDFVGQAAAFLKLAGEAEGQGRDEDALAFLRDENAFRNAKLVELPNGDFAFTLVRQYFFDAWDVLLLDALSRSTHATLAGIAAKALKEAKYHVRHSAGWVLRLGDGTEESHRRTQQALNELWSYTGELFESDEVERALAADGVVPSFASLRAPWETAVRDLLAQATLVIPDDARVVTGGRRGRHTEYLGHMLAEMQILPRSHPGATW